MKLVVATAAVTLLIGLAACTASPAPVESDIDTTPSASATPTPTPTPSAAPDEEAAAVAYTSIEALRLAFIEATGEECPPFSQYSTDANGVICTQDGWQLFWKASKVERDAVLALNVGSVEPSPFVVGPNWLINGQRELSDYQVVADAMNAIVWTKDIPIPTE